MPPNGLIEIAVGLILTIVGAAAVFSTVPPFGLGFGLLFGPVVLVAGVAKFVVYVRRRASYAYYSAAPHGPMLPSAPAAAGRVATCPACGTGLLPDARFCGGCGRSLWGGP